MSSTTVTGLQNQIDTLAHMSNTFGLDPGIDFTKLMVRRKGGRTPTGEKCLISNNILEVVNRYKYLECTFITIS